MKWRKARLPMGGYVRCCRGSGGEGKTDLVFRDIEEHDRLAATKKV